MARFAFIFISFLIPLSLAAQEPDYLELVKAETRLQVLFTQLYSDSLSDKELYLDTIQREIFESLSMQGAMDFPWSRLDRIGIVTSADHKLRLFTWHMEDDFDHFRYFGFIQVGT